VTNLIIKAALTTLGILLSSVSFSLETQHGFVTLPSGQDLYIDSVAPETPEKPIVVILNGLTYSTQNWDAFAGALRKGGFGIVRYDMRGMGQTLLKYAPILAPIEYHTQLEDLKALLQVLNIPKPYNLLGLSYGGGMALAYGQNYPEDIGKLIVMAPYTEALKSQDDAIKQEITATRLMYPFNPATDEQLYDYFLQQIVYTTYPSAEPSVLANPYILQAVFEMAVGVRHYNAKTLIQRLPAHSVHMMIAGNDQYIPRDVLTKFWSELPAGVGESVILVEDSEHKIPEAVPKFSAAWAAEILNGNPEISGGASFDGHPFTGIVTGPQGNIQVDHQ
jgi:pimeloyl-ACP methyl ester carboxylesterase